LESKRNAKYLLLETGNRAAIVIPSNKIDAMLITHISNENAVYLEIIHEKIKFFAVCTSILRNK